MNKPESSTIIVPEHLAGQRIDRVLAQLFPDWSRVTLCKWLKEEMILINSQSYKPNAKVWGGEIITFQAIPEHTLIHHQAEAIPLDIVFEDEHILVLNKPAGLIVHPGAGNPTGTLLNALLHHHPALEQVPRAGIVHRLDKDTSGLLIIAKSLAAHTQLIRLMQAREIKRQYLALVYGHVIAGQMIHTGYGRDSRNRLKMAVCANEKPAITEFTVLKHYQFASLLRVYLHTGRTHQIRVHMAHINHAIVGDPLYRGRNTLKAGMSLTIREVFSAFPRQALHAQTLAFDHPILNVPLAFEAPIPYDFQSLLTTLDEEQRHERTER